MRQFLAIGAADRRPTVPHPFRCVATRLAVSFLVLSAVLAVGTPHVIADPPSRPNIILIMADDIGYECFGTYGSEQYRTPQIDAMAAGGMRFTHCYSQPLCTPSRVKLMTGISNVRNYSAFSVLNRDQRTIGQYFRDAGYATAVAGKWQLLGASHYSQAFRGKGTWPEQAGFDKACLWQVDQLGSRYWNPLLYIDGANKQFGKDEYGPLVVNQYVLDFMQTHRERPFFVYYPMILVHNPFEPTPDSDSRTSQDKQRNFEDMVAYMDRMVGNVVAKSKQLGIADKTLILFVGDNGTNRKITSNYQGKPFQGGKGLTTDAGTRVPFVAHWPGTIPAGTTCEALVDFSDFLPTLLEATGISQPQGMDGISFLRALQGERVSPRKVMYCYYNPRPERKNIPPIRFTRDRRYKLYGDGRFFDLQADDAETQDLARGKLSETESTAYQQLKSALQAYPSQGQSLLKYSK